MTTDNDTPAKPAGARRAKATVAEPAPSAAKTTSKSDTVIKLLLRAKGATPLELIAATDWQPHSLRAFLSGLRKKGRTIVREERKGGGFAYRIVAAPTGEVAAPDTAGEGTALAERDDTSQVASVTAASTTGA